MPELGRVGGDAEVVASRSGRIRELAIAKGEVDADADHARDSGGFDGFLAAILKLRADLDVPHTLADFKIGTEKRDLIAEMAIVDPTAGGNPIELTLDGAKEIFDRAMEVRL